MPKRNAPASKGEGVICQLPGDNSTHTTSQAQIQYLAVRLALPVHRAALLAPLAFGVVDYV